MLPAGSTVRMGYVGAAMCITDRGGGSACMLLWECVRVGLIGTLCQGMGRKNDGWFVVAVSRTVDTKREGG